MMYKYNKVALVYNLIQILNTTKIEYYVINFGLIYVNKNICEYVPYMNKQYKLFRFTILTNKNGSLDIIFEDLNTKLQIKLNIFYIMDKDPDPIHEYQIINFSGLKIRMIKDKEIFSIFENKNDYTIVISEKMRHKWVNYLYDIIEFITPIIFDLNYKIIKYNSDFVIYKHKYIYKKTKENPNRNIDYNIEFYNELENNLWQFIFKLLVFIFPYNKPKYNSVLTKNIINNLIYFSDNPLDNPLDNSLDTIKKYDFYINNYISESICKTVLYLVSKFAIRNTDYFCYRLNRHSVIYKIKHKNMILKHYESKRIFDHECFLLNIQNQELLKIINSDKKYQNIIMQYCGISLYENPSLLPKDYKEQLYTIFYNFDNQSIYYPEFNLKHILVYNDIITLIDFSNAQYDRPNLSNYARFIDLLETQLINK